MTINREWESLEVTRDRKSMQQFDRLPAAKQDRVRSALACLQWLIFELELSAYTVVDPVTGEQQIAFERLSVEQLANIANYAIKGRKYLTDVVGIVSERRAKHVEWPEVGK